MHDHILKFNGSRPEEPKHWNDPDRRGLLTPAELRDDMRYYQQMQDFYQRLYVAAYRSLQHRTGGISNPCAEISLAATQKNDLDLNPSF